MAAAAANDEADIICSNPCVKEYINENAPDALQTCSKEKQSNTTCSVPGHQDQSVYDIFGNRWNHYARPILENFFMRGLDDRHGIYTKMVEFIIPGSNGDINAEFKNTDNFKKCKDTICLYRIRKRTGYYYSLFHISLHSKTPIFIQGRTPRIFTCGGYPLTDLNQGAFHYKIDMNSDYQDIIDSKIFKELQAQEDGTFFKELLTPINISKQTHHDKNYAIFHEYIYRRFIDYWNRCVNYVKNHHNINSNDVPWKFPLAHDVIDGRDDIDSIKNDFRAAIRIEMSLSSRKSSDILSYNQFTRDITQFIEAKRAEDTAEEEEDEKEEEEEEEEAASSDLPTKLSEKPKLAVPLSELLKSSATEPVSKLSNNETRKEEQKKQIREKIIRELNDNQLALYKNAESKRKFSSEKRVALKAAQEILSSLLDKVRIETERKNEASLALNTLQRTKINMEQQQSEKRKSSQKKEFDESLKKIELDITATKALLQSKTQALQNKFKREGGEDKLKEKIAAARIALQTAIEEEAEATRKEKEATTAIQSIMVEVLKTITQRERESSQGGMRKIRRIPHNTRHRFSKQMRNKSRNRKYKKGNRTKKNKKRTNTRKR